MSKETKAIAWILIVIIIACLYGWYNSEQNRLKLLDELHEAEYKIEELTSENESLHELIAYYDIS